MPRQHGKQSISWWSANVPTTGPTGTTTTYVANLFRFTVPGRLNGIRFYDATGSVADSVIAFLIDDSFAPGLYLASTHLSLTPGQNPRWHQLWFHPFARVVTGHDYWVVVLYVGGGFYRNTGALAAGAVTRNGIQLVSGFQTTALDLSNVAPVMNTNANAVDVLFLPD